MTCVTETAREKAFWTTFHILSKTDQPIGHLAILLEAQKEYVSVEEVEEALGGLVLKKWATQENGNYLLKPILRDSCTMSLR